MGMKVLIQKGSPVPAVVVNGMMFSSCKVPNPEELEARVQEVYNAMPRGKNLAVFINQYWKAKIPPCHETGVNQDWVSSSPGYLLTGLR
jgi:hypothetical protein